MAEAYSFNFTPEKDQYWNSFLPDGTHTYDELHALGVLQWDTYEQQQTDFIARNYRSVFNGMYANQTSVLREARNVSKFGAGDYLSGMGGRASQVYAVSQADVWEGIKNLVDPTYKPGHNVGTVVGMDLETIGNMTMQSATRNSTIPWRGITEMGFYFQDFENGFAKGKGQMFDLAIGLSPEREKTLRGILGKYTSQGSSVLNPDEIRMLGSMSVFGQVDYNSLISKQNIDKLGGEFLVVNESLLKHIGERPFDAQAVSQGIANWARVYKEGGTEDVVMKATKLVYDTMNTPGTYMVGANSGFEASALSPYFSAFATTNGIQEDLADKFMRSNADVVLASRTNAKYLSQSAHSINSSGTLARLVDPHSPSTVESLMHSLGMVFDEEHHGGMDSMSNVFIATGHDFIGGRSFADIMHEGISSNKIQKPKVGGSRTRGPLDVMDYSGKYLYMHSGYLDKNNLDFFVPAGAQSVDEVTQSMTIRGNTYTIEKAGWTTFQPQNAGMQPGEAEEVYSVVFLDDDGNQVVKSFANEMQADDWIDKHTITMRQTNAGQRRYRNELSRMDDGRRKFDSFFEPQKVHGKWSKEAGGYVSKDGFEGLEEYLQIYDEIKALEGTGTKEEINEATLKILKEHKLGSAYNVRQYNQVVQKISDEEVQLKAMVDFINKNMPNANNVEKTTALQLMRDNYIQSIEQITDVSGGQRFVRDAQKWSQALGEFDAVPPVFDDVYGLQVLARDAVSGNMTFKNVNVAQNNITGTLERVYRDSSKEDIIESIETLHKASIFDDATTDRLVNIVQSNNHARDTYYNTVFEDLGLAIQEAMRPVTSLGPTSVMNTPEARALYERAHASGAPTISKDILTKARTLYYDMDTASQFTMKELVNKGVINADIITRAKGDETVRTVLDRLTFVDKKDSGSRIQLLLSQMGYGERQAEDIAEIFTGTNKDKAQLMNATYRDKIRSFILRPEQDGDAFVLLTNMEHETDVAAKLLKQQYDSTSMRALERSFEGQASVLQIHAIHSTEIAPFNNLAGRGMNGELAYSIFGPNVTDDQMSAIKTLFGGDSARLSMIYQGDVQEKILTPSLNVYKGKDGQITGYIGSSGDQLVSGLKRNMSQIADKVAEGEFARGTSLGKLGKNDEIKHLSSPSSYRLFGKEAERLGNYHPNDILHAFQFDGGGLRTLANMEVAQEIASGNKSMGMATIVEAVGLATGQLREGQELTQSIATSIMNSNQWDEFYSKNIINSSLGNDGTLTRIISTNNDIMQRLGVQYRDKNLLDIMIDDLTNEATGKAMGSKTLIESLTTIQRAAPLMSGLTSPDHFGNALGSGKFSDMFSFVTSADFIDMGGLHSAMRPTFNQILNSIMYDPEQLSGVVREAGKRATFEMLGPKTVVGSYSQSLMEYGIKNHLVPGFDNVYGPQLKMPGNKPWNQYERVFTAPVKQMSEADLMMRYTYLDERFANMADTPLKRAYMDFKAKNISIHEGKGILAPALGNQAPMKASDGKKVFLEGFNFDISPESRELYLQQFDKYAGKDGTLLFEEGVDIADVLFRPSENVRNYVNSQDVIDHIEDVNEWNNYVTNRHQYYYGGPNAHLTKQQFEAMIEQGESHVIPDDRMVNDIKMMFSQEKATVRLLEVSPNRPNQLQQYQDIFDLVTGYKDFDDAGNIITAAHDYRPVAIGNFPGYKHKNQLNAESMYNIIVQEYAEAGKLNELAVAMEQIPETAALHPMVVNGDLITSQYRQDNLNKAIQLLYDGLDKGGLGVESINENIRNAWKIMNEEQMLYLKTQRSNVNEVMAEITMLDERMAQTVRMRAFDKTRMKYYTPEQETIEQAYLKAMENNADYIGRFKYGKGSRLSDAYIPHEGLSIFEELDKWTEYVGDSSKTKQIQRYYKKKINMENTIESIRRSVGFYTGEIPMEHAYNISMDDAIKVAKATTWEDAKESIFTVDGKKSNFLSRIAEQQGEADAIFLQFSSGIRVGTGKDAKTLNGVLIPVFDVTTLPNGQIAYIEAEKSVTNLLRVYRDNYNTPEGEKKIADAIVKMENAFAHELHGFDKTTLMSRTFGKIPIPNSQQFLGQDEMPAMVDRLYNYAGIQEGIKREGEIKKFLANADFKTQEAVDAMNELNDIIAQRKTIVHQVADELRNAATNPNADESLFSITALREIGQAARGFETVEMPNGKMGTFIANAYAINKKSMKKMGVDFGAVGQQLFREYAENGRIVSFEVNDEFTKFLNNYDWGNVADMFDGVGYDGTGTLLRDVLGSGEHVGSDEAKKLARAMNDALKEKKKFGKLRFNKLKPGQFVNDPFEELATAYFSQVGIVGRELWRHPTFSAQPPGRYYLDKNVDDGMIRILTAGSSVQIHIDFDGDAAMASLVLDSRGGLQQLKDRHGNILTRKNDEYAWLYRSYQRSLMANNNIMADLLEDMDFFKKDFTGDTYFERGSIVQQFYPDEFNAAAYRWAKSNGIEDLPDDVRDFNAEVLWKGSDGRAANPAIEYQIMHSDEVQNAFYTKASKNIMNQEDVMRAAMASRTRKINIGSISTPNYKLRDTLLMIAHDTDMDDAVRTRAAKTISILTEIASGGLMDVTEQTAIDVKHLFDAVDVARTTDWARGLSEVFNNKRNNERAANGLRQMMLAVDASTFKLGEEKVNSLWEQVLNGNVDDFYNQYLTNKTLENQFLMEFSALYDIRKLPNAIDYQNAILRDGHHALNNELADLLIHYQGITGTTLGDIFGRAGIYIPNEPFVANEFNYYVTSGVVDSHSTHVFQPGRVFQLAEPITENQHGGYIAYFEEIDLDAMNKGITRTYNSQTDIPIRISVGGRTHAEINEQIRAMFAQHGPSDTDFGLNKHYFRESAAMREEAINRSKNQRLASQLNSFTIDKDKVYNYSYFSQIVKEPKVSNPDAVRKIYGEEDLNFIKALFPDDQVYNDTINTIDKYNYWRRTRSTHRANSPETGDLIRQLNEQIANSDHSQTPLTYNESLEKYIVGLQNGPGQSFLSPELQRAKDMVGDLDFDAFDKEISRLNSNVYDIMATEQSVIKQFDDYQKYLDKLDPKLDTEGIKQFRQWIGTKDDILSNMANAVKSANTEAVAIAEEAMYGKKGLIQTASQLEYMFSPSGKAADAMVAFGEYMGVPLKDLTADQVSAVLKDAAERRASATGLHAQAIDQTAALLRNFTVQHPEEYAPVRSQVLDSTLNETLVNMHNTVETMLGRGSSDKINLNAANEVIRNQMKNKSTTGGGISGIKEFMGSHNINGKTVGVAVAAMAALGVANNLLHHDKNKSPVSPEFNNDHNRPSFKNGEESYQAPETPDAGGKYYVKQNGLQFKVSANTKRHINEIQQARMINTAGGGSVNMHTQTDNSGVTDNWLANKFAQLTF